ncbi:MAG: hypothetical protein C5B60_04670 [Chloroflexi bacterium]|nr:MAG: hypothetical protein C5B60_04670 [Chloroflexota bacterium]
MADEDEGLASAWRERAIDLRRLSWPLRLVIAVTILATAVASVLIIIRDVPQSQIVINGTGTIPAAPIPTAAFVAALVLWVLAWSLALTGAIFGHWALRLLVVITFIYISITGYISERSALIVAVPLVFIALWVLAVSMARWLVGLQGRSLPQWLPLVSFFVVLAALSSHYAILLYLDKQGGSSTATFPQIVELEFGLYAIVLIPVLFLTGSDFGEWAEIAAGQVNDWLKQSRSTWVLLTVSALVAAGIVIEQLQQSGTLAPFGLASVLDLVTVALFGLVTTVIFFLVARLGHIAVWPRVPLPAWALILATITTMLLLVVPYYVDFFVPPSPANSVDYSVFRHSAQTYSPAFSLAYPSNWNHVASEPQQAGDPLLVKFMGTSEPGMRQFWLVEFPTAGLEGEGPYSIEQAVVSTVCQNPKCSVDLVQAPSHGSWFTAQAMLQDQDANGKPVPLKARAWERTQGDSTWVLYGAAEAGEFAAAQPIYTAMLDSWKPNLGAVAPTSPTERLDSFLLNIDPTSILSFALLPLAVAIVVGIPLLLLGRRRPGPAGVAGLFLTVYGLYAGLLFFPRILAYFGVPTGNVVLLTVQNEHLTLSSLQLLSLPRLQLAVALFTLLLVVWLIVRRAVNTRAARDVLATALLLNVSLLGIQVLDNVFSAADQIALRLTEAQGVLLLLAFLWDLLTSGKQVTNTEGRNSPRSARVLLYAGFSLLSCSQVLLFSTLGGSAGQNYGGDWTGTGLTALGIPVLLTVILLRFARVGQQQQASLPQGPVGAPVGEPGQTLPDAHLPGIYDAR